MPKITPAPAQVTSEVTDVDPIKTRGSGLTWRLMRWALGLSMALTALAAGAWWVLLTQIVPKIDQWREPLAQQATSALGVPVKIGQVQGRTVGWVPELTLKDVAFLDRSGHVSLRLPEVTARLSASSLWPAALWRREIHVASLTLVRPELEVRRDSQGKIHVAGLVIDPQKTQGDASPALDWVLDQSLIQITQGSVTWIDEWRRAPAIQLTALDLSLVNRPGLARRVHEWQLTATPPGHFGQRFTARALMTQPLWARGTDDQDTTPFWARWVGQPTRASDWRSWSGSANIDLPKVDVQALKLHASLPFDVQGGHGRVAMTLAFKRGQPSQLSLDVDVQQVAVKLASDLAPLAFKSVKGRLDAEHLPTTTTLGWQGLAFTTDDGLSWPASQARLSWVHPPAPVAPAQATPPLLPELQGEAWKRTQSGQLSVDRLDLALLARLADRLPIGSHLRDQLAQLSPTGIAQDIKLTWQGPASAPSSYQTEGKLSAVGWAATAEHPGASGAELTFKATEQGGEAAATLKEGWLEFPGVFDEARIPVQQLATQLTWKITPRPQALPTITLNVKDARFANADVEGTLSATWATGAGQGVGDGGRYPGTLQLTGQLSRGQADRVWRYLPSSVLVDARHYVRDAVRGGSAANVNFEVSGDLWQFPFKDDQGGKFRVAVPMKDVTLDYVPFVKPAPAGSPATPYWPVFSQLSGLLVFEGQRMRIEDATAVITNVGSGQFGLSKVNGVIEDLAADDPALAIEGQGQGPLEDLLRYLEASPIAPWTDHMLSEARGKGRANLSLSLSIPLNRTQESSVQGQVNLTDADAASLKLGPQVPTLSQARGVVQFTQNTLKVQANAKVWGQDFRITGDRNAQGMPRFVAQGLISGDGLKSATEWPGLAQVGRHITGQTPVTVTVALNRTKGSTRPELQVNSTLQGLGINLPAPLQKPAAEAWPLKLVHRQEGSDTRTDRLQLELGGPVPWLATYLRDLSGPQARIKQGQIHIGPGTSAVVAGKVVGRMTVAQLDLDAWQTLISEVTKVSNEGSADGRNAPHQDNALESYLPDSFQLKTDSLTWRQRTFKDMNLTLSRPAPQAWRAQIEAPLMAGTVDIRPEGASSKVLARLSRLAVPAAEAEALADQAAQQLLSTEVLSVPALDIVIDQFDWRGLPLGKLEVEANNRLINTASTTGAAPLTEWRLTKFKLSSPDAQLQASGNWAALGAQSAPAPAAEDKRNKPRHRAAFGFTLDLNNTGNLLTRLGLPQTLKGGKGKMSGQVAWLGSPLELDAASLNGDIKVAIEEGQFLKVDPGMAKLLGVLSLQSLPRRLILDFRDVFQQGFAFDRIDGDVKVTQGVADTRNLRMRGVQAVVLMEGQADLAQETQNLRVFVIPEINAGTASLAYAAINPAIGLGTFIAQILLRKTVVEANTREFTVKGSWADPQVERVQKTSVPAAEGPPPPASSPASGATGAVRASQKPS